jgi:hypothetical protein
MFQSWMQFCMGRTLGNEVHHCDNLIKFFEHNLGKVVVYIRWVKAHYNDPPLGHFLGLVL